MQATPPHGKRASEDPTQGSDRDLDVVVVGGGVAGLTVARDLTAAGHRVLLLEATDIVGGTVARAEIDGLALDVGAESFAVAGGSVAELLADLGLSDAVVQPIAAPAWVRHHAGAAPLPARGWLGIPARPWARDVRRVIGWPGALRASADQILPARFGRARGTLGGLVAVRLGRRVLARLVEPVIGGVYSTAPDLLPLERLAPRAQTVLHEERTLQRAAARIRGVSGVAGSQVAGLRGGMYELVEALTAEVVAGGEIRTATRAVRLRRDGAGWLVETEAPPGIPAAPSAKPGAQLTADAVVLAGSAAATSDLLGAAAPANPGGVVTVCTLVVDSAALDAAPRGSGVLVAAGVPGVRAKAVTHATAKWAWLATAAGPHRHVLRLSYGRVGDPSSPEPRFFPQLALDDASALLGIPLVTDQLRGWRLNSWPVVGNAAGAVPEAPDWVMITGGWVAGTGLAAVVTHARRTAADLDQRLRVSKPRLDTLVMEGKMNR